MFSLWTTGVAACVWQVLGYVLILGQNLRNTQVLGNGSRVWHARAMSSIVQVVQSNKSLAYCEPTNTLYVWNGQTFNSDAEESK